MTISDSDIARRLRNAMRIDEEDATVAYSVVVNHGEQRALWPHDRENAPAVGTPASWPPRGNVWLTFARSGPTCGS